MSHTQPVGNLQGRVRTLFSLTHTHTHTHMLTHTHTHLHYMSRCASSVNLFNSQCLMLKPTNKTPLYDQLRQVRTTRQPVTVVTACKIHHCDRSHRRFLHESYDDWPDHITKITAVTEVTYKSSCSVTNATPHSCRKYVASLVPLRPGFGIGKEDISNAEKTSRTKECNTKRKFKSPTEVKLCLSTKPSIIRSRVKKEANMQKQSSDGGQHARTEFRSKAVS